MTPEPLVGLAARRWADAVHRHLGDWPHRATVTVGHPPNVVAAAGTLACTVPRDGEVSPERVERRRTPDALHLMVGRPGGITLCLSVPPDRAHPLLTAFLELSADMFSNFRDQQSQGLELRTLAHEVRNPLMLISGYAEMLDQRGESEVAELIRSVVDRIDERVDDFLAAGRPLELVRLDLGGLVGRVAHRYDALAEAQGVRVVVEAQPVAGWVDPRLVDMAVANLIKNALEAMPTGGRLSVHVGPSKDGAEIVVADTGAGVARDVADQLFQPYVSTKQAGHGLGLALASEVVARHGGTVRLLPTDEGARFCIWLPAVPPGGAPAPG